MASQSFRNLYSHLPPPAVALTILIGVAEVSIFGFAAFANPASFAIGYGVPLVSSSTSSSQLTEAPSSTHASPTHETAHDRTQKGLVAAIAARNIQNGVNLLTFACYLRDRRALGVAIASGLLTTTLDTWIVDKFGAREMIWGHVFGIVSCIYGGWALLW